MNTINPRYKQYHQKRLANGDTRLSIWLTPEVKVALDELVDVYKKPKGRLITDIIMRLREAFEPTIQEILRRRSLQPS